MESRLGVNENISGDDYDEQSKPLLSDATRDGEIESSSIKVAEYLPEKERLGFFHSILRTLYGRLPASDVPRIVWVRRCVLISVMIFGFKFATVYFISGLH